MFKSGYEFLLKSEIAGSGSTRGQPVMDFTRQNMSIWQRVLIIDDIFNMNAYGEISFEDAVGFFTDN